MPFYHAFYVTEVTATGVKIFNPHGYTYDEVAFADLYKYFDVLEIGTSAI